MEERSEGILLRPAGPVQEKLSWEETAKAMALSLAPALPLRADEVIE